MASYGPDHIRRLRGERTRAAFAQAVGVSPLTVYRWELPDGAPEARRPRGRILAALRGLEEPTPPKTETSEPPGALDAAAAHLSSGNWRRAEQELVAALAAGRVRGADALARTSCLLLRVRFLASGDVRAAFSAMHPLVAQLDRGVLSPAAEADVHLVAALVYAQPDGELFDPGKVHTHVTRAARAGALTPEQLALAWVARVGAAFNSGDQALVGRVLAEGTPSAEALADPLLQCVIAEGEAVAALLAGNPALARRRFEAYLTRAQSLGAALAESRASVFLALRVLDDAEDPSEALALVTRANQLARSGRLGLGMPAMLGARVEGEALLRLGRFAEAEAAHREGLRLVEELGWSPLANEHALARLYARTGALDALRATADRLTRYEGPVQRLLCRASGRMIAAWADLLDGIDLPGVIRRLDAVLDDLAALGGWQFVEREGVMLAFAARVLGGSLEEALDGQRRAERFLDRFPSASSSATWRRLAGLCALRQGRVGEARQLLAAAFATFSLAGDVPERIQTRHALALAARFAGEPDGDALLLAARDEAEATGVHLPPLPPAPATAPPRPSPAADRLAVPVERLCLRGVPAGVIRKELLAITRELFPDRLVTLEPAAAGPGTGAGVELGDGAGGRLRLAVSGELDDAQHGQLRVLTLVGSLAMEVATLRGLSEVAPEPPPDTFDPAPELLAASLAMRRLKSELGRLAASRATVIITGESGTGKEIVARTLHRLSVRRDQPFLAFNCAAVPRELFEGLLFGYRKGSFTGATSDHDGVIRSADRGTLFLDEVGELPLDVQPKLLRFLENAEVLPVGGTRPVQVDVRVVAATHRDLARLVREGRFREDLYYRLQVVPVAVPPLRDRPEDIPVLARAFLRQFAPPGGPTPTLGADAVAALAAHAWPGNVRELRNVVERTFAYAPPSPVLGAGDLRW